MARRKTKQNASNRKVQNGILTRIKFAESYTSLILGAIVVLIAGILFLSFARGNRNPQTSSVMVTPKAWEQVSQGLQTSSTYTVNAGDDLWTISENVYHDGYRWVEIARANNLENPGLIHAGDKLVVSVTPQANTQDLSMTTANNEQAPTQVAQGTGDQNNSIVGDSYTVVRGDNLWDIAVRAYGDGFRWPEIARANNLKNPSIIHSGNVFIIPR